MDYEFHQAPVAPNAPPDPRKMRLAQVAGFLIGAATLGVLLALGLSPPVSFLVWIVLMVTGVRFVARVERGKQMPGVLLASLDPATASPTCPRCGVTKRNSSGWCSPCFGALAVSSSGTSVLAAMAQGINARDYRAMDRTTKFPYTSHIAGVGTGRVSRKGERWLTKALVAAIPDLGFQPVAAFEEASDPAIIWVRFVLTGHAAKTGRGVRADRIMRGRLANGKLVELWEYPPARFT